MGTENPNRSNYPLRPAATPFASQQSSTPFLSSGPVAGSEASVFRPGPPATSNFQAPPFSGGPLAGNEFPTFRPPPSGRPNEVVRPPPPSSTYGPPPTSGYQSFPNAPVPPTGQVPPPHTSFTGQPGIAPPTRPPAGPFLSQPQPPLVPMGSPPQSIKAGQPNSNIPPTADQHFSAPRPNSQPSSPPTGTSYGAGRGPFPGYANMQPNSVPQTPPMQSGSFQQGGYAPPTSFPLQGGYAPQAPPTSLFAQQRGYAPVPPISTPSMYSGNQIQQHGMAPPLAGQQGLAEDFSSLSLGSVPGSFDSGLDVTTLPRPLDGDVEPKTFADMYPMNCDCKFVRLSTSGIPNSQSLASRWHLPLGAVVCPLAETPPGVSLC